MSLAGPAPFRVALEEFVRRFPRYTVDEGRCVRAHGYESVPFAAG